MWDVDVGGDVGCGCGTRKWDVGHGMLDKDFSGGIG